jgi:hypothetical protein
LPNTNAERKARLAGVVAMGAQDLRRMMEHATGFRKDYIESRFTIDTRFRRKPWEVIVEPLSDEKRLEVITAYERWDDGGQKTR